MTVDFNRLHEAGFTPVEAAVAAEFAGMRRLEIFKAIHSHWGRAAFVVTELEHYVSGYPNRAARAAATVGLAVLVLNYPEASIEDVENFERSTNLSRKIDSLARAGRTDDALSFYDRLSTEVLELTPITEAEARAEVRRARMRHSPLSSVVIESSVTYPWGWLFSPHLESGAAPAPLPDTDVPPIIIDRFVGVPIVVMSDDPLDEIVERYELTGWPDPMSRNNDVLDDF